MKCKSKVSVFCLFFILCSLYSSSQAKYEGVVISRTSMLERHRRLQNAPDVKKCQFKICEHVNGYPSEKIKNLLQKNKGFQSYSGNVYEPPNLTSIDSSIFDEYGPVCIAKIETKFPKYMKDVDDKERFIANIDQFNQTVKFHTCLSNDCYGSQFYGFETKCEQQYHVIKLVTVNMETDALEYAKFEIPSTCSCVMKQLHK